MILRNARCNDKDIRVTFSTEAVTKKLHTGTQILQIHSLVEMTHDM